MPINSRNKGAAGEREFAKALHEELGVTLARNLEQSRQGGHDLLIVDDGHALAGRLNRFAFEVKRYREVKPGMVRQWWAQAVSQAQNAGKLPALAYTVPTASPGAWSSRYGLSTPTYPPSTTSAWPPSSMWWASRPSFGKRKSKRQSKII